MTKHTLSSFSILLTLFHVVQGLTPYTLTVKKSNTFMVGTNKHLDGSKVNPQSLLFLKQNKAIGRIFDMDTFQTSTHLMSSKNADNSNSEGNGIWNPELRKVMGTLSAIGMLETSYLTFLKLTSSEPILCSSQGSCGDVLNGPYASVGDIPLAAFGFIAYTCVTAFSLYPIVNINDNNENTDDSFNRLALVSITTSMATFSSFLLSLLFSILHESCIYCYLSAALSISLGFLSWFGGAATATTMTTATTTTQSSRKTWPIPQTGLSSAVLTTIASIAFYVSIDSIPASAASPMNDPNMPKGGYSPPPTTTTSSKESIALAKSLNELHAQMFGAYWCSHCYDQKQTLGYESMAYVPYIECAREGKNSQTDLCKEKNVPGYPTWVIGDELFPGEQSIEELQEIVTKKLAKK